MLLTHTLFHQYVLNCGGGIAGSCNGGTHTGAFELIYRNGFVPYDTCMPYIACSSDNVNGFCPHVDTSCTPINTCRTCTHDGGCFEVSTFPNATIAEYGTYSFFTDGFSAVADKIKAEIYARGPVAASINAEPLLEYQGGIVNETSVFKMMPNHVVSIVGWGKDPVTGQQYWHARNSWGEYWGELGMFRIVMGKLSWFHVRAVHGAPMLYGMFPCCVTFPILSQLTALAYMHASMQVKIHWVSKVMWHGQHQEPSLL